MVIKRFSRSMLAGLSILLAISNLGCSRDDRGAEAPKPSESRTPLPIREIFQAEEADVDLRLQAILESPDDIVAVLVEGDNGWLADAMADTVKLAPFDERRRAGFEALLNITRRVLKDPSAESSPEELIFMPPRSIYLIGERFRVVPSYGDGAILDLMREFHADPRYEVRRQCTYIVDVLGTTVREHAADCDEILRRQIEIEKKAGESAGIEDGELTKRIRHIERSRESIDSILNHAWEPASIPDTYYRSLQLASREDLIETAGGGDWVALAMLQDAPPAYEERERLLDAVSDCQAEDPMKAASILQAICYSVRTEEPRDSELARVDQLLDWFERELDPSILRGIARDSYIKCLHALAGWPMGLNEPVESPKYLDRGRGMRVIALMEMFSDSPEGTRLADRYMEMLRRIYDR